MLDVFERLVREGRVKTTNLSSVRVKLHVPCQWSCYFCHMEGNHESDSIRELSALLAALRPFRDRLGFNEVHLTGGEPSIHPQVKQYIRGMREEGFAVKMTTNGQLPVERYLELAEAGLSEVNLSIHTLSPVELAQLMSPARTVAWAEAAIASQLALCRAGGSRLKVKVNTCIGASEKEALGIAALARETGASWRIMKVLDNAETSYAAMQRLCDTIGAQPQCATLVNGTSSCSLSMRATDGFSFTVKLIRPLLLRAMCSGCKVLEEGRCFEFAYGPRIEDVAGRLLVRNCLYRSERPQVLPVPEFFGHELGQEFQSLCR